MNLLIVDDEIYIVRAIVSKINWQAINIDNVFTSFNVENAKEVFRHNQVDILLTDIEMPGQSGLDLAKWVIEQGYNPVRLCLTCHAEFEYAQEAISLGFSDYYVKPIVFEELSKKMAQTVLRLQDRENQERQREQGSLWEANRQVVLNSFWNDLVMGRLGENPSVIHEEAEKRQVEYPFEREYSLVLIKIRLHGESEGAWGENKELLFYALQNIALEVLETIPIQAVTAHADDFVFVYAKESETIVRENMREYVDTCFDVLDVRLVAYLSKAVYGEGLHSAYQCLQQLDRENISFNQGIFYDSQALYHHHDTGAPVVWEQMHELLENKRYAEFAAAAKEQLRWAAGQGRKQLLAIEMDILQLFGVQMKKQSIWFHELLDYDDSNSISRASESLETAFTWLDKTIEWMETVGERSNEEYRTIERVKAFIEDNLGAKMSRNEIANHVHLSADYLNKVFKSRENISLIQYVIERKMESAAKQIREGKAPIGEIAQKLGYDNFSYFSNLFKKNTGMTPSEYKQIINKQVLDDGD